MDGEKQHVIEIRGKVQMIGFRNFIEANALSLGLGGTVFNDKDGSVKILCEGAEDKIKTLIRIIEAGSADIGGRIESIVDEEIQIKIPLPPTFFKEPTVELKDIKGLLDEGIGILKNMDGKLTNIDGKLTSMDGKLTSMDGKLTNIDGKLTSMDGKLTSMDGKLTSMDGKLTSMDGKLTSMDGKLGKLDKLDGIGTTLGDIKGILKKIAEK